MGSSGEDSIKSAKEIEEEEKKEERVGVAGTHYHIKKKFGDSDEYCTR